MKMDSIKKIQTEFCLEVAHSNFQIFGVDVEKIKSLVPLIINNLLGMEDIRKKSCINEYKFNKLCFDILFIDDAEIHKINLEYRKKDSPTDVITFALFADDENKFVLDGEINLGEIIISLDTAFKQADNDINRELLTLITHGILHLLGFDHQTNEDYNFIVDTQKRVLEEL